MVQEFWDLNGKPTSAMQQCLCIKVSCSGGFSPEAGGIVLVKSPRGSREASLWRCTAHVKGMAAGRSQQRRPWRIQTHTQERGSFKWSSGTKSMQSSLLVLSFSCSVFKSGGASEKSQMETHSKDGKRLMSTAIWIFCYQVGLEVLGSWRFCEVIMKILLPKNDQWCYGRRTAAAEQIQRDREEQNQVAFRIILRDSCLFGVLMTVAYNFHMSGPTYRK